MDGAFEIFLWLSDVVTPATAGLHDDLRAHVLFRLPQLTIANRRICRMRAD